MKFSNKTMWCGGALALLVLAGCGGDGSSAPFGLGTATSNGRIDGSEANLLTRATTETGEPEDVRNLVLATSETDLPFDLPD